MKLQKVNNYNLYGQNNTVHVQTQPATTSTPDIKADEVSFSGKPDIKAIQNALEDVMPNALTGMKKAKESMGEVQNIVINALGTGLIAPIFIKWNPLSKTDEDTRTYSAWRQPVSALLAVATQAAVTIPFNSAIKNMAKSGALPEKFNETPYCAEGAEDKLLKTLRNENTIYYNLSQYDGSKKLKAIDPERYKTLLRNTLEDLKQKEDNEYKKCDGPKKEFRIKRSLYYQAHSAESEKLLNELNTKLNAATDIKDVDKYLTEKIKEMKKNKVDSELIKIVEEVQDLGAFSKENWLSKIFGIFSKKKKSSNNATSDIVLGIMKDKVNKMKGHVNMYKGLTPEQAEKHALESITERLESIKVSQNFLTEALEKLKNGATVSEIERMFKEKSNAIKDFRLKDKVFGKEVISKLKELTKNNIGVFKQISGLIVSFAMLPITCTLLNYLYPIFMDTVFPNLSNKKHSNVSSDLIAKATKNSEVK